MSARNWSKAIWFPAMNPGLEIGIRIDHCLLQDATGSLVMLELEAFGLDRVKAERALQYVDHNLLQADFKNMDDHVFLQSAAARFGFWFSRPGNGISLAAISSNQPIPRTITKIQHIHQLMLHELGME